MSYLIDMIESALTAATAWSVPRDNDGKLVALTYDEFEVAGYYGLFESGDFVFVSTRREGDALAKPAIYVVSRVKVFSRQKWFEIQWELRLIGGSGTSKISLYYQHPYGQNPHAYAEEWFPDLGYGPNMPKLNYYVEKVVRNGKTLWDVRDALESQIREG